MEGSAIIRKVLAWVVILCIASMAMAAPKISAVRSPRLRYRMDSGWRFRRDPITTAQETFDWMWIPSRATSIETNAPQDLESLPWQPTHMSDDVFGGKVGFAWFRALVPPGKFGAPTGDVPTNLSLHFEGVDDNAEVFVNGRRMIVHRGYGEPFEVPVGDVWLADQVNTILVLVENTGGPGGVSAPVSLESPQPDSMPQEAAAGFDDHAWRQIHLPHDYIVEGTFDERADTGHGSLPVAQAWYRKGFVLPAVHRGKSIWLDFDGVYRNGTVYFNGRKLGTWPSGYAPVRYNISGLANFGGKNTIAVRVDPRRAEGWWYEGGGIYRHVWMTIADPVHVRPTGTFIQTSIPGPEGQAHPGADLSISTMIDNVSAKSQTLQLISRVVSPTGKTVATIKTQQTIAHGSHAEISQAASLRDATLWSIEHPAIYRLVSTIVVGKRVLDQVETPFGIRTVRFDKNAGCFINGKHVELKGTCNHQDFAGVGVAMPDGLLEWRIRKLKMMGSNAYRCSHNPPAAELLDACDRLGMVVMDETRHFGDAEGQKSNAQTKTDDLSELKAMVLRDRNHPSIIMWSLANEEFAVQGGPAGKRIFSAMKEVVRSLDPTRPCTAAMNGGQEGTGISRVEDLLGFNYGPGAYDRGHAMFPDLPAYGSETASTVGTRGIYSNDATKGYVAAYDIQHPRVNWGNSAEDAWRPIAERPWMAGGFVWTGFDYKGEPTPYGWPCINSHFGIMDMCGFPKDNYYYYQAWWGSAPIVHILPHWNWRGSNGHPIPVWVFSNASEVELFLNGRSFGRKTMPKYGHLEWTVPYASGRLVAYGYRNRKMIASDKVETTGAPAAIRLRPARSRLLPDGEDLIPVTVEVVDAAGRVVPTAMNPVTFKVAGPAQIVGVGNGDPSSHEPDKASSRKAFNGLCMVLVGSAWKNGAVTLTASSPGLRGASLHLVSSPVPTPAPSAKGKPGKVPPLAVMQRDLP